MLNPTEQIILREVTKRAATVRQISDVINMDHTTVRKYLWGLQELGLVEQVPPPSKAPVLWRAVPK